MIEEKKNVTDISVKRCGFITILGAPNAGKSTLMNHMVGSKVSIVTPKVQTTRTRVTGITMEGKSQLIFIDTPGIFSPQKSLDKAMVKAAWDGIEGSNLVMVLVAANKGICRETEGIIKQLKQRGCEAFLVINKIDIVAKPALLNLTIKLNEMFDFKQTFMISAKKGKGTQDLRSYLGKEVPEGQWHYPEDQISDIHLRLLAAEITREKLMLNCDQELPYHLMVDTDKWEEKTSEKGNFIINIYQTIYVTSESHKKIIVGRQGQHIKQIGEKSRKELSYLMDEKVNLYLFVKVKEKWLDTPAYYSMFGLES